MAIAAASAGGEVWQTTRRRDRVGGRRLFLDLVESPASPELSAPPQVDVAVFCGAVTSMQACAENPESSRRVNVTATSALARRLADVGSFVVFLSSNQVFNGRTPFAKATDPVDPQTEYGRQKVETENEFLELGESAAVLRLSKVLTADQPVIRGWIEDLRQGRAVEAFDDMVLAPVAMSVAVGALLRIVSHRSHGITQLSAASDITYAEVARFLAEQLNAPLSRARSVSHRERGIDFAPAHTTLDGSRIAADFRIDPPDPWSAIKSCVMAPVHEHGR